jgi:hypothetical protein
MSNAQLYINHLHTVHSNSLTEDSPHVEIPDGSLNIPLHSHQKAVIAKMEKTEQEYTYGTGGENSIFSNYGILGDSVGVGKSHMILAHIIRLRTLPPLNEYKNIHPGSSTNFFSIRTRTYGEEEEAGCLIIVPHTLFRQWVGYVKQTNLKSFCIARASQILDEDSMTNIMGAEVTVISSTLLKGLVQRINALRWKRIFIDEADTIHLPRIYKTDLNTRFMWLITASWINLMYLIMSQYFDKNYINTMVLNEGAQYSYLKPYFHCREISHGTYYAEHIRVRSHGFFRDIVSTNHPSRARLVIRCSDEYVKKSILLPPLIRTTILCRTPVSHQIIQDAVSQNIQQMLHAGDTASALDELGVKGQDTKTLIEAVTANLNKELTRLEKTYSFKESLEYFTPQAKEAALKSLKEKIDRSKESIKAVAERIKNFETEMCPICYEEPSDHLVTPCCSRVFCAACLLLSMATNPQCPLCRGDIHPSMCTKLILKPTVNEIVDNTTIAELPKKHEALLAVLQENPKGKFLIFSRYDNPFESIESAVESLGIKVRQLKGNKDAVAATLRGFESGAVGCLLLNSRFAGSGLNITAATHVILLHAMTHEEEKQILGRAHRFGRTNSLNFVKLLHNGEGSYFDETGAE